MGKGKTMKWLGACSKKEKKKTQIQHKNRTGVFSLRIKLKVFIPLKTS